VENIVVGVTFQFWAILVNFGQYWTMDNFGQFLTIFGHFNIIVQGYLIKHIFYTVPPLVLNTTKYSIGLTTYWEKWIYKPKLPIFPIFLKKKTCAKICNLSFYFYVINLTFYTENCTLCYFYLDEASSQVYLNSFAYPITSTHLPSLKMEESIMEKNIHFYFNFGLKN